MFNMGNTNVCKVLWHVRGARAGLGWAGPPPGPGPCSYVLTHASCHARVQGPPILTFCPDIFVFLTISPGQWRSHLKQSIIVDILPWGLYSALLCLLCGHREAKEQDISRSQVSSFQCSSWLHTVPYPNFLVLIFKLHTHAKTLKISTTGMVRTAVQHSRVVQQCSSGCSWAVRMLREVWRIFS